MSVIDSFNLGYFAKEAFVDSLERTQKGFQEIREYSHLTGVRNVLLARIESAAAFFLAALSALFFIPGLVIIAPCFLIPTGTLNLLSRLPGISSLERAHAVREKSNELISRTCKVCLLAFPVLGIFLSASAINTFFPGVLKPQNVFSNAIDQLVAPLGDLEARPVYIISRNALGGSTSHHSRTVGDFAFLTAGEEHLRVLSSQNYYSSAVRSFFPPGYR